MASSAVRTAIRHHRPHRISNARHLSSTTTTAAAENDNIQTTTTTTTNQHYPHLFQPLSLGPHIGSLPNRVIMGSMHTGLEGHSIPKFVLPLLGAEDDHTSLEEMAVYFGERAKGGVGLMGTYIVHPAFI